jgi:hypothetical protein
MTKKEPHLQLRKERDSSLGVRYSVMEVQPGRNKIYRGKIFALRNDERKYAFVYREVIPAVSGPASEQDHLLDVGEYPLMGREDFIETFLDDAARAKAKTLADKLNLPLVVV